MITEQLMYWIIILPKLACTIGAIGAVIGIIGGIVMTLVTICWRSDIYPSQIKEDDLEWRQYKWVMKICWPIVSICILLALASPFVPSTKEFIAIKAVPAITNDEKIQNLGSKSIETVEAALDAWLKDVRDNKNKK